MTPRSAKGSWRGARTGSCASSAATSSPSSRRWFPGQTSSRSRPAGSSTASRGRAATGSSRARSPPAANGRLPRRGRGSDSAALRCAATSSSSTSASTQESRIVAVDLAHGTRRVLRASRIEQLTNPSVDGGSLVYVRASATAQELVRGPLDQPAGDRTLLRAPPTALRDLGYEPGYSHHTRTPRPGRSKTLSGRLLCTSGRPTSRSTRSPRPPRALASSRFRSAAARLRGRLRTGSRFRPPTAPPVLVYTASNRSQDVLVAVTALGTEEVVGRASRLEDPAWSADAARLVFAGTRRAVRLRARRLAARQDHARAGGCRSKLVTHRDDRFRPRPRDLHGGRGRQRAETGHESRPALPGACVVAGRNTPGVRVAPGRQLGHLRRRRSRAQTSNHANTGRRGISVVVAGRRPQFRATNEERLADLVGCWDGGSATRLTSGPGDGASTLLGHLTEHSLPSWGPETGGPASGASTLPAVRRKPSVVPPGSKMRRPGAQ